jgi:hypothetical protein
MMHTVPAHPKHLAPIDEAEGVPSITLSLPSDRLSKTPLTSRPVVSIIQPSLPASLTRPPTAARPPTQGALPTSRHSRSISSPSTSSSALGEDDESSLPASFTLSSTKKAVHSKSSGSVHSAYSLQLQPIKKKAEGDKLEKEALKDDTSGRAPPRTKKLLPPTSANPSITLGPSSEPPAGSITTTGLPTTTHASLSPLSPISPLPLNGTANATKVRPRATSDPPRVEMPEEILSRIRDHKLKDTDHNAEEVRYTDLEEEGDDGYYDVYPHKGNNIVSQTKPEIDDTSPTSTQFKPVVTSSLPIADTGSPTSTQLPKTRSKRGHKLPISIPVLHKTKSKSGSSIILDGDQSPCSNRVINPELPLVCSIDFNASSYSDVNFNSD